MAKRSSPKKTVAKKPDKKPATVNDGTLTLNVSGGKFNGKSIQMDVTVVELLAARLENRCGRLQQYRRAGDIQTLHGGLWR